MDVIVDNWPVLLIGLGAFLIVFGLIRRLVKLAFFGVLIGVAALIIWPMIAT